MIMHPRKHTTTGLAVFGSLMLSLCGAHVEAASIFVPNHSFEDGDPGAGGNINQPPWRDIANSGNNAIPIETASRLGTSADPAPDGTTTYHYTNATTDSIYQVLTTTLLANTTYTLTVDVGDRTNNNLIAQPGAIRLGFVSDAPAANDDYGQNLLAATILNNTVPVNGAGATDGWQTWQSTFETGATPVGLGQQLRIELVTFGGIQTLWDNVRLDAVTIPEPSSILLIGSAGVVWLFRRRR